MALKKKTVMVGFIFVCLLCLGGLTLIFTSHDAVAIAIEKKEGILTAEEVKLAFENIGGRLIIKQVQESQEVKKGDALMVLDSTDVDLAIQRLETQIKQTDAKIGQMNGSIAIGYAKTATAEEQTYRQIEQQKSALDAAKATYDNQLLTYNRKKALADSGAVSPSELDSAQAALDVASANVNQQQSMLNKMLAGSNAGGKRQVLENGNASNIYLPEIDQQRQTVANNQYGVQELLQQKQNFLVQLKELQVKKERLTLKAPEDGKVLKIIAQVGEMIAPNAPVILLETRRQYFDIYVDEAAAAKLCVGDQITGRTVANTKTITGAIRLITAAPGFADLKMSREKGQADLAAFQIRIYVEPSEGLLPGMTIEVKQDAFSKR